MNKDYRLVVGFWVHPKTIKLKKRLGLEGVVSLLRLWEFVTQYKPDGTLINMDHEDIECAANWEGENGKLYKTLIELRWLDLKEGICYIHEWEEHNGYAAHAKDRSELAKNLANKRWATHNKLKEVLCGTQCGTHIDGNAPLPVPDPLPVPNPIPLPKPDKKKDKILYGESVFLTEIEYQKLIERFGKEKADDQIENLELYSGTHPKEFKAYTSHYKAIIMFFKLDAKRQAVKDENICKGCSYYDNPPYCGRYSDKRNCPKLGGRGR